MKNEDANLILKIQEIVTSEIHSVRSECRLDFVSNVHLIEYVQKEIKSSLEPILAEIEKLKSTFQKISIICSVCIGFGIVTGIFMKEILPIVIKKLSGQ